MSGMSPATGRSAAGIDHISLSIADILTTPLGQRVMRRDYGSLLPELIDHPDTPANRLRLLAAAALAIMKWEPRIILSGINIYRADTSGRLAVDIEATRVDGARQSGNMQLAITMGAA